MSASGQSPALRSTATAVLAASLLTIAVAHLLYRIFDNSSCFMNGEVFCNWYGTVFLQGKAFSFLDFINAFDSWGMDGDSRPRFLSYLFSIWSIKARIALWDLLPPHPSFSPVWLLSALLAPFLLYRFLLLELAERRVALIGTGLYLASVGFLSSVCMFFHQGKPLANLALIVTLYWAARARLHASAAEDANPRFSRPLILFMTCLLPLLLLDETALYCLLIIPLWTPRYFVPVSLTARNIRTCVANGMLYSIPPLFYLAFTFLVNPLACRVLLGRSFDFGSYLSRYGNMDKFSILHALQHATTLFGAVLLPWSGLNIAVPVTETVHYNVLFLCLVLAGMGGAAWLGARSSRGGTPLKALLLVALYVPFQTYVAAHHPSNLIVSGHYYGAQFSVLMAVLLAGVVMQLQTVRHGYWLSALLAGYVLCVQLYNFPILNGYWQRHNNRNTLISYKQSVYNPFFQYADMSGLDTLSDMTAAVPQHVDDIPAARRVTQAELIQGIWHSRQGGYRHYLQDKTLALRDLWLLAELYYWRTPGSIAAEQVTAMPEEDLGVKLLAAYRAAVHRAHYGAADQEALPALAARFVPSTTLDSFGFDTKLVYPARCREVATCTGMLRQAGFSFLLVPTDMLQAPPADYWHFNQVLYKALFTNDQSVQDLVAVGSLQVRGRSIAVFGL